MPFDLSKLQAYAETKEKPEKSESWDDLIESAFKREPEKGIPQQGASGSNSQVTFAGQIKNMPAASDSWDDLISAAFKNEPEVNTGNMPEATGLNDLKNRLVDFDKSNQAFLNEWDAKEKELEEVKKSFDPAKVNAVLSYLHENGGKRKQLKQEREELLSSIYNHPELIAERKEKAAELEKRMAEMDKLYDGSNVPVLGTGPGAYMMKGKKEQDAEREADRFSRAYKLYENAHDMLLAPSKFDKSNAFLNFAKGSGKVLSDKDFWTGGMSAIARNLDLGSIFKKISENKEGKDFKDLLTPGESSLLDAYYAQVNAQAERAKDLSLGYQAGQGAAQSLEYMAEFLATGGLATAASSGAKKAAMKWIIKHSAPASLKRQALKGAAWGAEAGVGTLARTPLMPSTYVNVTDPTRQFETDEKGNVLQDEAGRPVLKSGWKVFREGFVDSFIENLSEVSGGHIAGTLGVGGKIVGKVVPQGVREAFAKTGDWLAKSKPGEMYKSFSKSPVWKFLKEGGYNGLLEEWGEEWYGAALRSVLTDPSALKDYATLENQLVTVASFLPMSALGGGVATGQMLKAKGQYKQTLNALQGLMKDLGYKEEQVAYLTDQIEASDAEKMASTIAPLINTLAGENEEKAGELFKAVADFSRAKGNYHLMNGAYEERMAERKAAEDKRMEEETGGYVNSSTGRVEIVADEEGNTAYVAGESLDGDHKVYILNKGGEKISVSREDFEEGYKVQGSFDKDEFLGTIIMNRDLEEELASEKKEVQEGSEEGQNETVPVTGESGGAPVATYQEGPVRVVEGTEQEDGTVIVEDENGETMRVPAVELKVNNIAGEQLVNEVQTEDSSSPIQSKAEESAQPEIPLTKEGTPDYNAMSPEMFVEEFEKEFGPEETKAELEQMVTDVEAKIEKLHKKAPTDRNARAESKREILRLTKEKESVLQALERYAIEEKVPEENAEVIADYSAEPEVTEPEKGEVVNEEVLKKEIPASSFSEGKVEESSETGVKLNPAEALQEADNYEKGQVKIDGYENKIVKPTADEVLFREKENYTPEENIEEVNRRFNEELEGLTEKNADRVILYCGNPSVSLLRAGIPDRNIALYGNKLLKKAKQHEYDIRDVKNLPSYIQSPIAVFKGSYNGSFAILTEMPINGKNTLVSVDVNKGEVQDLNLVTSVFDKNNKGIIDWINEGKLLFEDKEKALNYLSSSAPIADATNNSELSTATNIIENFENPTFQSAEISSSNDDARYRFIGEKGAANLDKAEEATIRLDHLNVARDMEKVGKDAKAIKLATGWERGADGKWRYEEADFEYYPLGDANKDVLLEKQPWYDEFNRLLDKAINGEKLTEEEEKRFGALTDASEEIKKSSDLTDPIFLNDYVKDENLFKAYPELKVTTVVFGSYPGESFAGIFNENDNKIIINLSNTDDVKSVLAHEIQHAIQHIEGFVQGGNPSMFEKPFLSNLSNFAIHEAAGIRSQVDDLMRSGKYRYEGAAINYAIKYQFERGWLKEVNEDNLEDFRGAIMSYSLKELQDASVDYLSPIDKYTRIAGEVEARNVESRMNMTSEERRNSLASETEDVAREDQIFLNDALGVSASMESNKIEDINGRFNEELQQQINGTLPKGHVYRLGRPGEALRSAGIPNLPIELVASKLSLKASEAYESDHPFDLSAITNLPDAIQNPVAVFDSKTQVGSKVIMTELTDIKGNNFVVAMRTNVPKGRYGTRTIQINDIRSVYPKDNVRDIVNWINRGDLLKWADKTKLRNWLTQQRSNSAEVVMPVSELDVAANIIQSFENPTILEGEISAGIDQLSEELGVPVKKVQSRKNLPEGSIQRQMKNGRYPGLFDPKAGEVYMVMDEITDVADAQATMLHEIVGHKGIRGLFADKIGAFTQRVLDSMPENEREMWVKKYNGNEQLAAEEYVARFAEGYENPGVWEKIKAIFRKFFRELGINLKLSDNDLKYVLWKGVRSMQQDGTFMSTAGHIARDREIQQTLFREVGQDGEFADKQLNLGEKMRENFQDRMLSVRMLLDEVKKRGGRVTDYSNPYVAENLATSKSKAQIDDFNKQLWKPLMNHVEEFADKGKTREEVEHYMMAKHAPERNALLSERDGKENGSGITNEDAAKIVSEFEKDFSKESIDDFWDSVRKATRFTTDTWQKHGLIDKGSKEYYDKMYQYYVPLRGWEESEADRIEYLDQSRRRGSFNVNKKAKGRNSLADSPLAYIANMAHSAIIAGNKNDVKRNVFDMMALNKNPDLYHLKKVYYVNTGTKEEPVWVEQLERPATELWNEGRVKVDVNRRNEAKREFYKTKQHQVEVFVNGQKYIMEFNGNMGVRVANAVNGINVVHSELLQNSIGRVTRWMTANYTSKNPEFVVTNFLRDLGYAIPAYWMKGGKAGVLLRNMPKAFKAIHDDIAGKKVDSDLQKMYEEFKMHGGLTGYVHMTDIDSYKKWIERDIRRMSGDKTFGDVILRNKAMRAGADLLEYLAQMSENSTRFAVYMSERQEGKSITEAAYAAKEITTNFNRKGRYSGMLGSLYGFFNATVQGSANALGLAKRSPGKFAVYCGSLIMLQVLASSLCRMFGGDDEIGENNYDRLADWVKYNNLVLPDIGHKGRFITIPLPHFFRALSSLGVIGTEVWNGVKTPGKGLEAMFDAVSGDLTPVEIATPQFKNLPSFLMSVTPTALKPVTEAYAFNRNFMGLPVSREAMGDQKKTLPQSKLAMKRTNPTLISVSEWLNKAGGGGEYTTAEIGYNNKTGEVGREEWKTWMDVNPSKFEHVIEGIFGGRLRFFNNIYKTVDNVFKGEFEASTTPVLRPLYQTPKGESAWIKFYEVRDKVVDIDAKASEFMKTGNHDAYGIINYKNAALVETYKAYENVVKALNDALKIVSDPEQAAEIEKQRDEVVKEFAVEVKKLEREYKKEVIK